MEYEDITKKIIGCAYNVYNAMGFGFLESVYEKCLILELRHAGLMVEVQKVIPVQYKGENVGDFTADLVVEGKVIVELKSVHSLCKANEIQLVNYLVATGLPLGLLINFGERGVEVKRKVRQLTNRKGYTGCSSHQSCNPVSNSGLNRRRASWSEAIPR